jgi:hypothetical protein
LSNNTTPKKMTHPRPALCDAEGAFRDIWLYSTTRSVAILLATQESLVCTGGDKETARASLERLHARSSFSYRDKYVDLFPDTWDEKHFLELA